MLCYHGIATNQDEAAPFRSYIEDFKEQINFLKENGYTFLKPSELANSLGDLSAPKAGIIFDDALETIPPALDFLIQNNIPFGIAVIARRLRKYEPESGFMPWQLLKEYANNPLCEILNHTYNLHHLIPVLDTESNTVTTAAALEKPCWIPNGDIVYMADGDNRWYWDWSIIDTTTWGFPLFGTDPTTEQPITSTMTVKVRKDVSIREIYVRAALHMPASSGYNAQVEIKINGQVVKNGIIPVTQYETRQQWKEREFMLIPLDEAYNAQAGQTLQIDFVTQNQGNGAFRIYALPDFSGDYKLNTSCNGGDYPPGYDWPARPAIILSDGTGRTATSDEYSSYVGSDFSTFYTAFKKYSGDWDVKKNYNEFQTNLYVLTIGGTYSDGALADTYIRVRTDGDVTVECLRIKYAERIGERYPLIIEVSIGERTGVGEYSNPTVVAEFAPNWWDWHWQTIDIEPFTFKAGTDYYIRFKTLNKSPFGLGLVRIYMEQDKPPEPRWGIVGYDENNNPIYDWILPPSSAYSHEDWYMVAEEEYTDVYPDGTYVDQNGNWQWIISPPYDGPGKAFLDLLVPIPAISIPTITSIAYPFGAYYDNGYGTNDTITKPDLNPILQQILSNEGITNGWTIYPARFRDGLVESDLRTVNLALPRFLVYGNISKEVILNNLAAYTGIMWKDIMHNGIVWQTAEEYDSLYNAITRQTNFDFVSFDAYFFTQSPTIIKGNINLQDKQIVQQRGYKALIIFSNYDDSIDGPNPDIASYVLNNPDLFVPLITNIVTSEAWDGVYINLEWVPPDCKQPSITFFDKLAASLFPLRKFILVSLPAITGTNYDDLDWTGWCDYAQIAKYVNFMKIMTYTESGDFGGPAPHAPDEFFDAVYRYVNKTVPAQLKSRVLVGCNAFGHTWTINAQNETGYSCDYITFHEALADAIVHGVPIQEQDGEGYVEYLNTKCFFGTPNTVWRALKKSLDNGLGGVGIWKADDGDLLQHNPNNFNAKKANVNWEIKEL